MANNEFFDDRPDRSASEPSRVGRWLAVSASLSAGCFLAGLAASAYWYAPQLDPLTAELERLRLEKTKSDQDLQLARGQIDQLRTSGEAERARLAAEVKEQSDALEVARAAADEAGRKAAEAERQRLALIQERTKTKSDEAARVAAAQAELKKTEAVLKQKAAEIERQKQAVTTLRDETQTQAAQQQKELTVLSLAGTWQGTLESGGKTIVGTIELIQYGSGLVGKCTSLEICDGDQYILAESSLQQKKARLVYKYIYAFVMDLDVSPDASTMEGTWSHSDILGKMHTGTVKFQRN